jgi:hypothetical protein
MCAYFVNLPISAFSEPFLVQNGGLVFTDSPMHSSHNNAFLAVYVSAYMLV